VPIAKAAVATVLVAFVECWNCSL